MIQSIITTSQITRTLVLSDERMDILPRYCGKHFLWFEQSVYALARALVNEYDGGYWEYYKLSNGGFYMAFDSDVVVSFCNDMNYTDQEMSADAASIAVNLYACSQLSFEYPNEPFAELYHKLRDYAALHEQAGLIFKAID